jgi:hypothetical protein
MLDTLEQAWADANGGASIRADSKVTFPDPCTKSGVFPREIAKRLIAGLEAEIPADAGGSYHDEAGIRNPHRANHGAAGAA